MASAHFRGSALSWRRVALLLQDMIAGLEVVRSFCTAAEARSLLVAATRLSAQATAASRAAPGAAITSAAHNVNSQERFRSLELPLDEGGSAQCEHFESYADGHSLTYFRGRLPMLGAHNLPGRLASLPSVRGELARSRRRLGRPHPAAPRWKLTLNRYPSLHRPAATGRSGEAGGSAGVPGERVGFPWHRDLEANGAASLILSLGGRGELELGTEPELESRSDGIRYIVVRLRTSTQQVLIHHQHTGSAWWCTASK